MKKVNSIENKKAYIKNKLSKFSSFTSILKLTLALALFFIAAVFVLSADVIVQNGALNVSNSLIVNTTALFVDSANNRVGIGTALPHSRLMVVGTGTTGIGEIVGGTPTDDNWGQLIVGDSAASGAGTGGRIAFAADSTSSDIGNPTASIRGIRTATGSDFSGALAFYTRPASSTATEKVRIDASGNVGIGTTSPGKTFEVQNSGTTGIATIAGTAQVADNNWGHLLIGRNAGTAGTEAKIAFIMNSFTSPDPIASIGGYLNSGSQLSGQLRFYTRPDTATTSQLRMTIGENGNVGISTTTPNQRLMVAGNANITGTIYYGALQANSPVLERTAEPFVARCTFAKDGKLVVEYIDLVGGSYQRVIEAVDSGSISWWHKSCFEKNEKFKFLDSLNNQSITIEDIGFDWETKKAFKK